MARILVLTGSRSQRSPTSALALHVADELAHDRHDVHVLHLRGLPAQPLLSADTAHAAIASAVRAVLAADAVVVVAPIGRRIGRPIDTAPSSGLLEVFLDLLPPAALQGKVVLPLATGGTVAHPRAVDHGLRPVLASLGARHITTGRFVPDSHIDHLSGGPVLVDDGTRDDVARTLDALRDALVVVTGDAGTRALAPA